MLITTGPLWPLSRFVSNVMQPGQPITLSPTPKGFEQALPEIIGNSPDAFDLNRDIEPNAIYLRPGALDIDDGVGLADKLGHTAKNFRLVIALFSGFHDLLALFIELAELLKCG
jgi:hypothetical protein